MAGATAGGAGASSSGSAGEFDIGGSSGAGPAGGGGFESVAGRPQGGSAGSNGGGGSTSAGSAGSSDANGGAAGNDSGGQSGGGGSTSGTRPARVLLYSFSTLEIPSVPLQLMILKQKLESWQYQVDQSTDPAVFNDENLARYAAVGMINTCFSPFGVNRSGVPESEALQRFLQDGGGLFGTHCASVTFQSANPPALYNRLIGGRANSENFDGTSNCRRTGEHPTVDALPATFSYQGNLDNTDFLATDSVVLVRCTWSGANPKDVAVSWIRTEGEGRIFYTNFAKVDADLTNATLGDPHILRGLAWVLRM